MLKMRARALQDVVQKAARKSAAQHVHFRYRDPRRRCLGRHHHRQSPRLGRLPRLRLHEPRLRRYLEPHRRHQ